MDIDIPGVGVFEEKYSMLFRHEEFHFLGIKTQGLLKFNCIRTGGQIRYAQLQNYEAYCKNISAIDASLAAALDAYKAENGISPSALARVTSVQFDFVLSFLLLDTSWDPEHGMAAVFDDKGRVQLRPIDEIL